MFKLIIEDDEGHTTVVPLQKEEITIGRKEGNTIRLTERNVSRHHARLIRTNGSVFIEDLDSYNGIKVNGDRIGARTNIRIGDLVEIGDYHLALQEAAQAEAPPPTPQQQAAPPQAPPQGEPPPLVRAQASAPAPTVSDGGTAVLRLPVEDKAASDPGQVRPLEENQAGSLVVETTDLAGQVFSLNRTEITLGRTEENDIVLPHRSVSSRHAKLVFDGGIYRVMDLDSANGVLVNGEEYARVDIRKGDLIELGHVKLRYFPPGSKPSDLPASESAASSRRMVDASQREAELSGGGKGKLIGMIVGGLVVLGVAAFLVLHFMGGKTTTGEDVRPKGDDTKVADKGDDTKPAEGGDTKDGTKGGDAVKLPSLGNDEAKVSEAAALFKEGLKDMGQSKWDAAIDKFSIAVTMDPDNKGARSMLEKARKEKKLVVLLAQAQASIRKRDWDDALEKLQGIPEDSALFAERERIFPEVKKNYTADHLTQATRLEKAGKFKEAIKHVDAVIMFDEKNFLAQSRKKELLAKLRRGGKTRPPKQPRPPRADSSSRKEKSEEFRKLGMKAHRERKLAKAVGYYKKALKFNRSDHDLYRLIGAAYALDGKRAEAYSYYKKYVTKCPKCMHAPSVRKILKDYEAWTQ